MIGFLEGESERQQPLIRAYYQLSVTFQERISDIQHKQTSFDFSTNLGQTKIMCDVKQQRCG